MPQGLLSRIHAHWQILLVPSQRADFSQCTCPQPGIVVVAESLPEITQTILQLAFYSEFLERLSVRGRFKRQPHIKLCAIGTRAEVDFSVMPVDDDPVADNQAESRA